MNCRMNADFHLMKGDSADGGSTWKGWKQQETQATSRESITGAGPEKDGKNPLKAS